MASTDDNLRNGIATLALGLLPQLLGNPLTESSILLTMTAIALVIIVFSVLGASWRYEQQLFGMVLVSVATCYLALYYLLERTDLPAEALTVPTILFVSTVVGFPLGCLAVAEQSPGIAFAIVAGCLGSIYVAIVYALAGMFGLSGMLVNPLSDTFDLPAYLGLDQSGITNMFLRIIGLVAGSALHLIEICLPAAIGFGIVNRIRHN